MENKTLGERLAEVEAKVTVSDRLVALETVYAEALVDTFADGKKEVDGQTLCYTLAKLDGETLIYGLAARLPVIEASLSPSFLFSTFAFLFPNASIITLAFTSYSISQTVLNSAWTSIFLSVSCQLAFLLTCHPVYPEASWPPGRPLCRKVSQTLPLLDCQPVSRPVIKSASRLVCCWLSQRHALLDS